VTRIHRVLTLVRCRDKRPSLSTQVVPFDYKKASQQAFAKRVEPAVCYRLILVDCSYDTCAGAASIHQQTDQAHRAQRQEECQRSPEATAVIQVDDVSPLNADPIVLVKCMPALQRCRNEMAKYMERRLERKLVSRLEKCHNITICVCIARLRECV
jgi:hypothetical protein